MLTLVSPAFAPGSEIPARFTCDGSDVSPPLAWSGAPPATRSFALIVDDPDAPDPAAPTRVWVHWLLYNLSAAVAALPEGAGGKGEQTPALAGAEDALNDWNRSGYGGPCPPVGRHRYFFKLYALDALLPPLGARARKQDVERAMAPHILAQAELTGTYQRP
jgi:Raf kinase inhibitor-like YbhB/YbcL family protein